MTDEKALTRIDDKFTPDRIALLKRTLARGATDDELALFIEQCNRTGLDPFTRQIYSIRRKQYNSATRSYEEAQVIQVSIDGFRLTADRTRKYVGQLGPYWCGPDGNWLDVWLKQEPPAAAKVGVLRSDFQQPMYAIALYSAYVQTNNNGDPVSRWKTDPAGMLAKCAEALALRRAFPNELSGLYTTEEMGQVNQQTSEAVTVEWTPTPTNGKHQPAPQPAVVIEVEQGEPADVGEVVEIPAPEPATQPAHTTRKGNAGPTAFWSASRRLNVSQQDASAIALKYHNADWPAALQELETTYSK